MKHFIKYWKWPTVQPRYDEAVPTLRHIGSRQLARAAPGDVIWMVTVQPATGILFLAGKLAIGWLGDAESARRWLGVSQLWGGPYHAVARDVVEGRGPGEPFKEISLRAIADGLRFVSPSGRDRLRVTSGRVHPAQLQTMRQLTVASARRLARAWDAAPPGRSPDGSGAGEPGG